MASHSVDPVDRVDLQNPFERVVFINNFQDHSLILVNRFSSHMRGQLRNCTGNGY
jgi:hypothetical protein